jgi:hypothetical protein
MNIRERVIAAFGVPAAREFLEVLERSDQERAALIGRAPRRGRIDGSSRARRDRARRGESRCNLLTCSMRSSKVGTGASSEDRTERRSNSSAE